MQRLNPYLTFDGSTRDAMTFYQQALGGELAMNTFAEYGDEGNDGIMHGQLDTPAGFTLMASDTAPGMQFTRGDNVSISLSGDDTEALHGYWDALTEGGQVTMPLEKQMWGDEFGMLVDRFGIAWMVNIGAAG